MTRLEDLEKNVVPFAGMNTADAQWALAMLREAEQIIVRMDTALTPSGQWSDEQAASWKAKLRAEV